VQIENPLNEWSFGFPLVESIHLLGIVCLLGAAALMNLRLIGVGFHGSPARLWRETRPLMLVGLAIALTSGFLLFTVALQEYYESGVFRVKIGLLLAAIAFYFTVVRSAALKDRETSFVAIISLTLYALVPLCGLLL